MRIQICICRVTVTNEKVLVAALVSDRLVQASVRLTAPATWATQAEQRLALTEAICAHFGPAVSTRSEIVDLAGAVDLP